MLLSTLDWKGNCWKIQDKDVGSTRVFLQRPRDAVRSLNIPHRAQHCFFLWSQHPPFPGSPLFKGLGMKGPHLGGREAKHFWKLAPFSETPDWNPQIQIPWITWRWIRYLLQPRICSTMLLHAGPLPWCQCFVRRDCRTGLKFPGHRPLRNPSFFVFRNDRPSGRHWPCLPLSS